MKELSTLEIESVYGGVLTDADTVELIVEGCIVGGTTVGALAGAIVFGGSLPLHISAFTAFLGLNAGVIAAVPAVALYGIYSKLS